MFAVSFPMARRISADVRSRNADAIQLLRWRGIGGGNAPVASSPTITAAAICSIQGADGTCCDNGIAAAADRSPADPDRGEPMSIADSALSVVADAM